MSGAAAITSAGQNIDRCAVLYVDDEEQALKYFKKAFGNAFPVLTANSVDAALAVLAQEHGRVGVLVSDQRMPGRTGVELLTHVRQTWPGIVRILMTAYADLDSTIAAVNSGAVYKYLTKPIDLNQTRDVLRDAAGKFLADRERDAVVRGKVSQLERVAVADRVSSMAAMASGICHHLRNNLTAMSCFFEEVGSSRPPTAAAGGGGAGAEAGGYLDELLTEALGERQRLLALLEQIESRGQRRKFNFGASVAARQLLDAAVAQASAAGAAGVTCAAPAELPAVRADAAAVTAMIATLIVHAARQSPPGTAVRVTADGPVPYWNSTALRVTVAGAGPAWERADVTSMFMPFSLTSADPGDAGLELFDAFLTALGHEGDVAVHRGPPDGPAFELLLPVDPSAVLRPALGEATAAR